MRKLFVSPYTNCARSAWHFPRTGATENQCLAKHRKESLHPRPISDEQRSVTTRNERFRSGQFRDCDMRDPLQTAFHRVMSSRPRDGCRTCYRSREKSIQRHRPENLRVTAGAGCATLAIRSVRLQSLWKWIERTRFDWPQLPHHCANARVRGRTKKKLAIGYQFLIFFLGIPSSLDPTTIIGSARAFDA